MQIQGDSDKERKCGGKEVKRRAGWQEESGTGVMEERMESRKKGKRTGWNE